MVGYSDSGKDAGCFTAACNTGHFVGRISCHPIPATWFRNGLHSGQLNKEKWFRQNLDYLRWLFGNLRSTQQKWFRQSYVFTIRILLSMPRAACTLQSIVVIAGL